MSGLCSSSRVCRTVSNEQWPDDTTRLPEFNNRLADREDMAFIERTPDILSFLTSTASITLREPNAAGQLYHYKRIWYSNISYLCNCSATLAKVADECRQQSGFW